MYSSARGTSCTEGQSTVRSLLACFSKLVAHKFSQTVPTVRKKKKEEEEKGRRKRKKKKEEEEEEGEEEGEGMKTPSD